MEQLFFVVLARCLDVMFSQRLVTGINIGGFQVTLLRRLMRRSSV